MARVGHGFVRYMDPTENVGEVADALAARLEAPVLTDIEIDWGDMPVADVTPGRVPDLFAGESVRVQGRYTTPGQYAIDVRGRAPGHRANLPLQVDLPDATSTTGGAAIAAIWARSAVKDAMHALITPAPRRVDGASDEDLKARVTQLGLEYSLVTRWTAFVATSEQIYNAEPADTKTRNVPLPMVKGVSKNAYPTASFGGHAAPEAPLGLALAVLLGLLGWATRTGRLRPRTPIEPCPHTVA
jgi:Ca-activated chloride channel family protein